MRNVIYTVLVLALCSVLAGAATAQTPVNFDAGFALYTDYAWRGYQVTDAASLQPKARVSWPQNSFSIGFWSHMALQDRDVYEDFDKVELDLAYHKELDKSTPAWFHAGLLYHTFPRFDGDGGNTTEIVLGYGWNNVINPSLMIYRDVDQVKAWYFNPSISRSFPLGQQQQYELDVQFGLGFNNKLLENDGDESFGLQNLDLRASIGIAVGANAELRPTLAYSRADEMVYDDQSLFWGGASLNWSW